MTINLPSHQGDLARCVTHEPDSSWPEAIEIVAYWRTPGNRRRKRVVTIKGDEFFGLTSGAPMTGDQLLGMVERLRRSGNGR